MPFAVQEAPEELSQRPDVFVSVDPACSPPDTSSPGVVDQVDAFFLSEDDGGRAR
jgi:hypothetical protein